MMITREQRLNNARAALEQVLDRAPRFRYRAGRRDTRFESDIFEVDAHNDLERSSCDALPWTPHLRVLLCGTRDGQSPLSTLRGCEDTILKDIYAKLVELWRPSVTLTKPAFSVGRMRGREGTRNVIIERGSVTELGGGDADRPEIAFTQCGQVEFPEPKDRNYNMLPFIMGDPLSLPQDLQAYYDPVIARCPIDPSEIGKVCYLTVSESLVTVGATQRRGGLHIEAPGSCKSEASFTAAIEHPWGMGHAYSPDELHGGIFMASSVDRTCKVWNALVKDPSAVDSFGGIEHLRPFVGEGYALDANELVWMTDKTPHEALPQEHDGYRQFFRLVTSEISVWFADHSTPNPEVPLPKFVEVINGNKFEVKGTWMSSTLSLGGKRNSLQCFKPPDSSG